MVLTEVKLKLNHNKGYISIYGLLEILLEGRFFCQCITFSSVMGFA